MNKVRERIAAVRRPLLGMACYSYDPAFVDMLGHAGVDAVWIEMEHCPISFREAADLCRIAGGLGLLTMIRIPDASRENVLKAAEAGPDIIDLPMANSAEVVGRFVSHARFAPEGTRGFFASSRAVNYGFGPGSIADIQRAINQDICLMAQIETREAVARADEIAGVPGLDAIFLGAGDLSASFGLCGQTDHPVITAALERAIEAARGAGKLLAMAAPPHMMTVWLQKGVELMFLGSNISCMKTGLLETLAAIRRETDEFPAVEAHPFPAAKKH